MNRTIRELEQIEADVMGEDIDRFRHACERLDALADASWVPRLYELLAIPETRGPVLSALVRLEGFRAFEPIRRAMHAELDEGNDADGFPETLADAMAADRDAAEPALRALLASDVDRDRADGANLWPEVGSPAGVAPLLALLDDPSSEVRAEVAGALPCFAGEDAGAFVSLVRLTLDADESVRVSAESGLADCPAPGSFDDVRPLLRGCPVDVRDAVEDAIRRAADADGA